MARTLTAFGETKTLEVWAMDARAAVWAEEIGRRLESGLTPEEAISRPLPGRWKGPKGRKQPAQRFTAWDETKSVREWADDLRARADYYTIFGRLRAGWPTERAISTPPREAREGGITAFGETKTAPEWAADPRCSVTDTCINVRLQKGISPEEAITRGSKMAERMAEARSGVPQGAPEGLPGHTRFLSAWGEVKSTNAWRNDPRCTVSAALFLKRIEDGMTPEAAISTPSKTTLRGGIEAFGETKILKEWAIDARCAVALATVASRMKAGWNPEAAISTPNGLEEPAVGERAGAGTRFPLALMLTAWGETKCLTEWTRDARCPVTPNAIRSRLRAGMSPEAAISTPDQTTDLMATAFGETKCVAEWGRDPRCLVTETCLRQRLKKDWDAVAALTTPSDANLVAAFGERRSRYEWVEDPRCVVSYGTFVDRLAEGMSAEAAMTTPPQVGPVPLTAWGETKAVGEWARDPRCVVDRDCLYQRVVKGWDAETALTQPSRAESRERRHEAFGEARTLREWGEDTRCAVPFETLRSRVTDYGMAVDLAMTTPVGVFVRGRYRETMEAWGETKRLFDWAADARCRVSKDALEARLDAGWPLEEALSTPSGERPVAGQPHRFVEAFGETKGVAEWARDARCAVAEETLGSRLRKGWDAERAISAPPVPPTAQKGIPRGGGRRDGLAAFGETKGLARWAVDPRCRVPRAVLEARLKAGWHTEDALTVAIGVPFDPLARAA